MRLHHKHFTPGAPLPPDPPDLFERYADARTDAERLAEPSSRLTIFDGTVKTAPCLIEPPSVSVNTSREAAARIKPHVARVREAIWLWLKTQGAHGATRGEISAALGISGDTCRPRLRELEGTAPWAPKLPRRIQRTAAKRSGMRIYVSVAPRDSGNP